MNEQFPPPMASPMMSPPIIDLVLSDILGYPIPHSTKDWAVICTGDECHAFKRDGTPQEHQWLAETMRKAYLDAVKKMGGKAAGNEDNGEREYRRQRPRDKARNEKMPYVVRQSNGHEGHKGFRGSPDHSVEEESGSEDDMSSFDHQPPMKGQRGGRPSGDHQRGHAMEPPHGPPHGPPMGHPMGGHQMEPPRGGHPMEPPRGGPDHQRGHPMEPPRGGPDHQRGQPRGKSKHKFPDFDHQGGKRPGKPKYRY